MSGPGQQQGWYDPSSGQVFPVVGPHANPYGAPVALPPGAQVAVPGMPYAMPVSYGTNGKAVASLVCAVAGVVVCPVASLAAIPLGLVARSECRRSGQDGAGMALAGVIVAGVYLALIVALVLFLVVAVSSSTSS